MQEGNVELIEQQRKFVVPGQFEDVAQAPPAEDTGPGPESDQDQDDECIICFDAIAIYRPIPCRCKAMYCKDCVKQLPIGKECHVCGPAKPHVTGCELLRSMLAIAHQRGEALDLV
jgi:hypothetical protein